jgi:hypothetical protein
MWTFDNPSSKPTEEQYGFTPTREWLDRVRLRNVRFNGEGAVGVYIAAMSELLRQLYGG